MIQSTVQYPGAKVPSDSGGWLAGGYAEALG